MQVVARKRTITCATLSFSFSTVAGQLPSVGSPTANYYTENIATKYFATLLPMRTGISKESDQGF